MRTAEASDGRALSDLTARARIRDAAVGCFAEHGFDTPFRTIAQAAGVSPGSSRTTSAPRPPCAPRATPRCCSATTGSRPPPWPTPGPPSRRG
ncbi:TetR/AcrR family transcriptional regulator [Cellulomonas soli]